VSAVTTLHLCRRATLAMTNFTAAAVLAVQAADCRWECGPAHWPCMLVLDTLTTLTVSSFNARIVLAFSDDLWPRCRSVVARHQLRPKP